jgi:Transglycosylase SLT domain
MTRPRHSHPLAASLRSVPEQLARLRAQRGAAFAGALVLALFSASVAAAQGETPSGSSTAEATTPGATTTTTVPAPEASVGVHGQVGEPAAEPETAPAPESSPPTPQVTTETTPTLAPEVQGQSPQRQSVPGEAGGHSEHGHGHTHTTTGASGAGKGKGKATAGKTSTGKPSNAPAPPPSTLTPPLPGALGEAIGGIPDFFIESFRVPPFLLPIYQAAGTAYDIPWQVLAAINEVETDYGRDLNVSSAGAEGWMQFLPSSWAQYGVDATGSGYEDPYNPADAIFTAARYLAAAGGAQHIRDAVYAYNHSAAYVEAVMLRAQLLGGTPPELLGAITGLTESRFPVHAEAHFSDGFPVAPGAHPSDPAKTLAGTVIYAPVGAPVIAVQDGEVTAVGESPTLGHYVSLRDAFGNTYTYAQLGEVAAVYPVLEPRVDTVVSGLIAHPSDGGAVGPAPSTPASAGVQPHSPLSQAAITSGLAMGAANALETPPAPAPPPALAAPSHALAVVPHAFRAGPDEVYLNPVRPGVQVLAGTVLGHVGAAGEGEDTTPAPATAPSSATTPSTAAAQTTTAATDGHMLFQIRPAGAGAPLIDPKPILDGWVRLEETSVFRAKGENPFLATSPTVGQVLLASKPQLEQLLLRDPGVHLPACERGAVRAGEVDRRVLAALEFLSVSGLSPTVSAAGCAHATGAPGAGNTIGAAAGDTVDISAIDGTPIAGHEGQGSVTDIAVRRLLRLQGTMKPAQIVSAISYPGTDNTLTLPGDRGLIHVAFAAPGSTRGARGARAASVSGSPLTPSQWLQLIAQLGEIPEPNVSSKPSAAAIPDPGVSGASTGANGDGSAQQQQQQQPGAAGSTTNGKGGE